MAFTCAAALLFQLSLMYLLGYIDSGFVKVSFIKFTYSENDEHKCSADDTIVFEDETGRSLYRSASKCFSMSSCFGVTRLPVNNEYAGCKTQLPDDAFYLTLEGNSYYRIFHTFLAVEEEMSWEEAKINCENLGGHLAVLRSEREERLAEQTSANKGLLFWLGGTRKIGTHDTFVWLDGTEFSSTSNSYTNWFPGEPNNGQSQFPENCMSIYPPKWNDLYCHRKMYSLCELL